MHAWLCNDVWHLLWWQFLHRESHFVLLWQYFLIIQRDVSQEGEAVDVLCNGVGVNGSVSKVIC